MCEQHHRNAFNPSSNNVEFFVMCERTLITARNNSWEKVMFSQVSVDLFSRGISGPMPFLGCISGLMAFPGGGMSRGTPTPCISGPTSFPGGGYAQSRWVHPPAVWDRRLHEIHSASGRYASYWNAVLL